MTEEKSFFELECSEKIKEIDKQLAHLRIAMKMLEKLKEAMQEEVDGQANT